MISDRYTKNRDFNLSSISKLGFGYEDYDFIGWKTELCGDSVLTDEQIVKFNSDDVYLSAQWERDAFPYLRSQGGLIPKGKILNEYEITFDGSTNVVYFTPTKSGYQWMCYVTCDEIINGTPKIWVYTPGGRSGGELEEGKTKGVGTPSPTSTIQITSAGGSAKIRVEVYYYKA